tara:strand:- start:34 stop:531 length:498 start_codon:yes stop_codon:yes gene_type:complete
MTNPFKARTKGTKDKPLSPYEQKLKKLKQKNKQKTEDANFSVSAGKFGDKSSTLSDIANKLGITLKSLKKENPQIKDLNKISKNQKINVPLRRQTFFEKYIAGPKTKPPTREVVTGKDKKETMAVKKGAEGKVYKGMSKKDMAAITLDYRVGGMVKSTVDNRKNK